MVFLLSSHSMFQEISQWNHTMMEVSIIA
uniref:Uncharacterized protein n=1 Tax=Anopheles minimus TaxID=112268 RepID=A0A182WNC3_9DIPT